MYWSVHPPTDDQPKYWAFISYSHKDQQWATRLHRALEAYRIPRRLQGPRADGAEVPARLFPIFRDRDELPTSNDLGGAIRQALASSRALIVICSPNSARSRWVEQEVREFKQLGRGHRIFCFIVEGEPNASDSPESASLECFCPSLRHEVDATGELLPERVEPLAADVRKTGDGKRAAFLKVMASVAGVGFDELFQRDRMRRRQRVILWASLLIGIGGVALGLHLNQKARHARELAGEREQTERHAAAERQAVVQRRWREYVNEMEQLGRAWDKGSVCEIRSVLLNQVPPTNSPLEDLRGIEWYDWQRRIQNLGHGFRKEGQTPLRYRSLAISPDRRWLAAANEVRAFVWELPAGRQVQAWDIGPGRRSGVGSAQVQTWDRSVSFSPDGKWVAATCAFQTMDQRDGYVRVWEVATGAEKLVIKKDPEVSGCAVVFSPDSRFIVAGGRAGAWKAWDLETQRERPKPETSPGFAVPPGFRKQPAMPLGDFDTTWDLRFTSDGKSVRSFDLKPRISPWEAEPIQSYTPGRTGGGGGGGLPVYRTKEFPDASPETGYAHFNRNTHAVEWVQEGSTFSSRSQGSVRNVDPLHEADCFMQNGDTLAIAGRDHIVRYWKTLQPFIHSQAETLPATREFRGHCSEIVTIALESGMVATADAGGDIRVWPVEAASGGTRRRAPWRPPNHSENTPPDPNKSRNLVGSWVAARNIYAVKRQADQEVLAEIPVPEGKPIAVLFSPNERFVAVSSTDLKSSSRGWVRTLGGVDMVRLWQLNPAKELAAFKLVERVNASGMGFSSNETCFAVTAKPQGLTVFNTVTGQETSACNGMKVFSFMLSPSGRYLAAGTSGTGGARGVWNLAGAKWQFQVPGSGGTFLFNRTETQCISIGTDVVVADLEKDTITTWPIRLNQPELAAVSPDSRRFYALTQRNTLGVFCTDDGRRLAQVPFPRQPRDADELLVAVEELVAEWKAGVNLDPENLLDASEPSDTP